MVTAPYPLNELDRLKDLYELNILDTAESEEFQQYTRLASQIADCPIALISIVDDKRQWFKAKVGIDVCETGRDISFCGHAIVESDDFFEISDATKEERFQDNPLVIDTPNIRYYGGQPLITSKGHRIGTLCVIDTKVKKLNESQIKQLETLARMIMNRFEERKIIQKTQKEILKHDEYLTSLSHEVKTPLTSIIGYSEIIKDELIQEKPSLNNIRENISIVSQSASQLYQLVKDILLLAKESNTTEEIQFEKLDLYRFLSELKKVLEFHPHKEGLTFKVSLEDGLPNFITTHRTSLNQVLINLLSNAFKYTNEGEVELKVKYLKNKNRVDFHIKDQGQGIPEEYQKNIFKRFGTDLQLTNQESTGIGLSIASNKATAMGGKIALLSSEVGKGSHFVFRLPLSEEDAPTKTKRIPKLKKKVTTRRGLVIDDSKENRNLVRLILKSMDVEVVEADSVEAGLKQTKETTPDFILLDHRLDDQTGLDFIDKAEEAGLLNDDTHVISFTASETYSESDRLKKNPHVDGFLNKPFVRADLIEVLNRVFE